MLSGVSSVAPRILVVEDDRSIREALEIALRGAGYRVEAVPDGTGALQAIETFRPDLAILDVHLGAGPDGFAVARRLRGTSDAPVLFLTAADAPEDRLTGFEVGADDYVVKPFLLDELLARVRALLRRAGRLHSERIEVGDVLVDEGARTAARAGEALDLTHTELELLLVLARHRGQVLSKTQLLEQVWGYDQYDPNVVEVHVSALRKKLEAHGPRLVHTVRGAGYVLRG
jgi:DNA-binding response OmpR family regulator